MAFGLLACQIPGVIEFHYRLCIDNITLASDPLLEPPSFLLGTVVKVTCVRNNLRVVVIGLLMYGTFDPLTCAR